MGTRVNFINIFTSFNVQMILTWAFPAGPIYDERLNSAERVNDKRHPINLRLFDWRIPALVKIPKGGGQANADNQNDGKGAGVCEISQIWLT